ncbi:MAG: hypothetical protein AAF559_05385 [Pseudomonadota bacterium]
MASRTAFALALAATTMVAGAAQAQTPAQPQAPSSGRNAVVSQFNSSTIARLLLSVQADFEVEAGANGQTVYRASAEGGLAFTLAPQACAPEAGCVGLLMIAVFTRNDSRSEAELDTLIHTYNDLNPTGKAYRTANGSVVLQGYINAAYGISYGNAQAQLLVFGQEIVKLRQALEDFSGGK